MDTTVRTLQGLLRGVIRNNCRIFYDIPYAAPPVGALRWCPPQPPAAWEDVRDATAARARCYQGPRIGGATDGVGMPRNLPGFVDYKKEFNSYPQFPPADENEDALVLNIWAPVLREGETCPVAVWIHGGAFANGSGNEVEFDGERYAQEGVILVTINYRLGLLGFFCHPDLIEEQGFCGNYGLLDQIAALQWVQENIGAFGGDPQRVTLFGQSAGCISVIHQLCCSETESLFQGVILQSGCSMDLMSGSRCTQQEAALQGLLFGKRQFGMDSIEQLRKLSPEQLREGLAAEMAATGSGLALGKLTYTAPVLDAYHYRYAPAELIRSGSIRRLPTMIGSNSEDIYPESMRDGSRIWAEAMDGENCYRYYFSHKPLGDRAGAFHSCELWYMFATLDRSWRPKSEADYALSEEMVRRWCAFIKTSSPNCDGLAQWGPCTRESDYEYQFN